MKRIALILLFLFLSLIVNITLPAYATESEETRHYLGTVVNTGKDNGYSGADKISTQDFHYGWKLGEFYIEDYTRVITEDAECPVFLKTVGDTVTLRFQLLQDIDKLNNSDAYAVENDSNGSDFYFEIPQTDFGRGALIIRHTDYQNHAGEPTVYTNFLAAHTAGADVDVQFLEEGDYEVALNYEIVGKNVGPLWTNIYDNYRIFFKFSVRNGNCMVYPFDTETGAELNNAAFTENGFRLDLAKSRYLDIDIKKETMNEGRDGLVEDVRFNKPAKDGEEYTDEGIYTITVSNRYTEQETVKKIYVGNNKVLKAHVTTGLSVAAINEHLAQGGDIADDGSLIPPQTSSNTDNSTSTTNNSSPSAPSNTGSDGNSNNTDGGTLTGILIGAVAILSVLVVILLFKKR